MIILDRAQEVADWVAAQSGDEAPTVDAAIGYEIDGQLRAGVYFDGRSGNNIFAHIASAGMTIPPDLLTATCVYVYRQLKLDRMTFMVSERNDKTIEFVRGMDALQECTLRRAARHDTNLILFVLWANNTFVQRLLTRGARDGK